VRALSTPSKRLYHYELSARSEMQPVASNQVFLTAERDRAGLFQAGARCVFSATDQLNVERTVRLLGEALLSTDRGRVRVNNDALYREATGGGHIMGTTRMGARRADSVVDRNCRVHGYENFFVAGSSLFPTGGFANPTFTIVALAVRLADEIARRD
jgi:choline dehydrogenase-like flavoprotein